MASGDLSWLVAYIDPRVAAAAVAVIEYLKGNLPESWSKGRRVRWLSLFTVAGCYVALWASEASAEIRHYGIRLIAIIGTYILSKVGYEAAKKVGATDAPDAPETNEIPPQATPVMQPPPVNVHGVTDVRGGTYDGR